MKDSKKQLKVVMNEIRRYGIMCRIETLERTMKDDKKGKK